MIVRGRITAVLAAILVVCLTACGGAATAPAPTSAAATATATATPTPSASSGQTWWSVAGRVTVKDEAGGEHAVRLNPIYNWETTGSLLRHEKSSVSATIMGLSSSLVERYPSMQNLLGALTKAAMAIEPSMKGAVITPVAITSVIQGLVKAEDCVAISSYEAPERSGVSILISPHCNNTRGGATLIVASHAIRDPDPGNKTTWLLIMDLLQGAN